MPVVPPVPVVPDGPTEFEPVLPDVPPDGALDMPAPVPDVESVVPPAVPPMVPLLPDVPPAPPVAPDAPDAPAAPVEPTAPLLVSAAPDVPGEPVAPVAPAAPALALSDVVPAAVPPVLPVVPEPPDIAPPLELVLPVEGEAVVLGVVVVVVEAPGDVVSAVRRSQPATAAVSATVASMSVVSLDMDCIEISLNGPIGLLSHRSAWVGWDTRSPTIGAGNRYGEMPPFDMLYGDCDAVSVPRVKMTAPPGRAFF